MHPIRFVIYYNTLYEYNGSDIHYFLTRDMISCGCFAKDRKEMLHWLSTEKNMGTEIEHLKLISETPIGTSCALSHETFTPMKLLQSAKLLYPLYFNLDGVWSVRMSATMSECQFERVQFE